MAAAAALIVAGTPPLWVVVGGEGLIGSRLSRLAVANWPRVVPTTRRPGRASGWLHADFSTGDWEDVVGARPEVVFVCAAITGMKACEEEPERARQVNVEAPVELAAQLMSLGTFVLFLSTNAVFDGNTPDPDEDAHVMPANAYGRQKADAEAALRLLPGADRQLAIVRLSKVLVPDAGIPAVFRRQLEAGQICEAFDDLLMCPVSADYVVDGLGVIAARREPGVFHLSGVDSISYASFARKMAASFGWAHSLVKPVTGAPLPFRPRYPALGMRRTRERLQFAPESPAAFWSRFRGDSAASREEFR